MFLFCSSSILYLNRIGLFGIVIAVLAGFPLVAQEKQQESDTQKNSQSESKTNLQSIKDSSKQTDQQSDQPSNKQANNQNSQQTSALGDQQPPKPKSLKKIVKKEDIWEFMQTMLYFIGAIFLLALIFAIVKRYFMKSIKEELELTSDVMMENFRQMRNDGKLSQEEYDNIRKQVRDRNLGKLMDEMNLKKAEDKSDEEKNLKSSGAAEITNDRVEPSVDVKSSSSVTPEEFDESEA